MSEQDILRATGYEQVCAMDETKGPLIVTVEVGSPSVRLALRRETQLVYVTYLRTDERDADGRSVYRE